MMASQGEVCCLELSSSFPFLFLRLIVFLYVLPCLLFFFSCSYTTERIYIPSCSLFWYTQARLTIRTGVNLAPCGYVCAQKTSLHTGRRIWLNSPLPTTPSRPGWRRNRVPCRSMPFASRCATVSTAPTVAAPRGATCTPIPAPQLCPLPHSYFDGRRRAER